MTTRERRLRNLEAREAPADGPKFYSLFGRPWTPEQKAAAVRRYPNATSFWRPLLPERAEDRELDCCVWPREEPGVEGEA